MVAILPVLAVLLIGAQLLGAVTLQSYGLALFVGLVSGAYSSIFIASPVLCMMKEREERWVSIAARLAKRGEGSGWYSAADAAALGLQISAAAGGQGARGGAGGQAKGAASGPTSAPAKRRGLIRPGSASSPGAAGTAVMERPGGGAPASGADGPAGGARTDAGGPSAKPRKGKGKRRR
jgi:preprotein translocase subunit SecF